MKTKPRIFNVVIERDQAGFYVASVPVLPGCHTQARSLDTLLKRAKEVIELCILEPPPELTRGAPRPLKGCRRSLFE